MVTQPRLLPHPQAVLSFDRDDEPAKPKKVAFDRKLASPWSRRGQRAKGKVHALLPTYPFSW